MQSCTPAAPGPSDPESTPLTTALHGEVGALAEGVAHSLRSPLWAVEGMLAPLLDPGASGVPPAVRRDLELALNGARRAIRMLNALARLAAVCAEALVREPVDLTAELRTLAADWQGREPDRRVAVAVQDGMRVAADRSLLRIALEQMFDNAWKFTRGVAEARVAWGVRGEPVPVYFVRDNGVGFDPASADRLFRPFQRLHAPAQYPGDGMGLVILRRIIHLHGGQVWAEGQPGQGATFAFTLPVPPCPADTSARGLARRGKADHG